MTEKCSNCKRKIDNEKYYQSKSGKILCTDCFNEKYQKNEAVVSDTWDEPEEGTETSEDDFRDDEKKRPSI